MKKSQSKSNRKELENSITQKFSEALKSLGHDAETLTREIKKAGKMVVNKISDRLKQIEKDTAKKAKKTKKVSAKAQVIKAKAKAVVQPAALPPAAEVKKLPVKKASVAGKTTKVVSAPKNLTTPKETIPAPVPKTTAKPASKIPAVKKAVSPAAKPVATTAKNSPVKKAAETKSVAAKTPAKAASLKSPVSKPSTKD